MSTNDHNPMEQEVAALRAQLAEASAREAQMVEHIERLEADAGKTDLTTAPEFKGLRQLSYHLEHGGLQPFLTDRALYPGWMTHLAILLASILAFGIVGYILDEVLNLI
jgi:hypothetical protein